MSESGPIDVIVNAYKREVIPRVKRMGESHELPEFPHETLPVYMDPIEWSQLASLLCAARPKRMLEWGCGGSTRAILTRCPFIDELHSIEHDEAWAQRVRDLVDDPRLTVHHVAPEIAQPERKPMDPVAADRYFRWTEDCEDDPSIMADYVAKGQELGEFDFIVVDGRARIHCWSAGFGMLRPGGILVMHDAQRPRYQETLDSVSTESNPVVRLEPWKQGQVTFVRKAD